MNYVAYFEEVEFDEYEKMLVMKIEIVCVCSSEAEQIAEIFDKPVEQGHVPLQRLAEMIRLRNKDKLKKCKRNTDLKWR